MPAIQNIQTRMPASTSSNGSKREQAYSQMRRLLTLQQIPQGTRLRESEWTLRLGVNRSALREAFAQLAAEGLIEVGPKTGYLVPTLTLRDIFEVLNVRLALEGMAIDIVCGSGLNTPENLKPMQNACELLDRLVRDEYHLSVAEVDWRFHEGLILAARHRRLAVVYRHGPLSILHPDIVSTDQWIERVKLTLEEHRRLLQVILNGDAAEAKEQLRTHLLGYWEGRYGGAPKPDDETAQHAR
jgi:DNA-binding GntR family transcriptional regulator